MNHRSNQAIGLLNNVAYPALQKCLQAGHVAVLIGVAGTGKSLLAAKALPSATLITSLKDGACCAPVKTDSGLIGEDLLRVKAEEFIKSRNQAIENGQSVIITGQRWQDVAPYLAGLSAEIVQVFNLNSLWGLDEWFDSSDTPKGYPVIELLPVSINSQQEKTQRAIAALDAMAATWAANIDLRKAVQSILEKPDHEDRLVEFIKQAHVEGLYEGRTSHFLN